MPSLAAAADALFFGDVPIVLTASRMEQSPLDAPAAVTVIDREMIAASGFTELHDLLRLVPGFLVADWADGSPTIANHGLGDAYNGRVKVMIDGRTMTSPMWGNTLWRDLPIRVDDVERIEVVRGPNGAAYGANAFQGVVNIITREPATEDGVTLISRLGGNGFYDQGVRVNGRSDGAVDWRLSASRRGANTFRAYHEDDGTVNPRERFGRTAVNFSASAQVSPRDELRLHVGGSDGTYDRGTPGSVTDPLAEEVSRASYLHLAWTHNASAESELTVQYFHQGEAIRPNGVSGVELRSTRLSSLIDGVTVIRPNGRFIAIANQDIDVDTSRDDLELQYSTRLSPQWQMLFGAGVRRESVRSRDYFNTGRTLHAMHAQAFGSVTWQPLDWLKINAGGTLEQHDYSGELFSPRLALNLALTPESSLRLAGGVAYRAPSFVESYAEQVYREDGQIRALGLRASRSLQPERVRYVDLGYVAAFREIGLQIDARVFRERYERYLDNQRCWNPVIAPDGSETVPTGRIRTPACPTAPPPGYVPFDQALQQASFEFLNSGAFVMDGAEFSIDWRRPGWGRVVLSQAFIEIDAGKGVSDPDFEMSAPQAMTSLLLIKDLPARWRASLGFYHNEAMYWLNGGDRVPGRDRVDLKLARRFGPERSDNEFAITAQSVGGRYAEFHEGKFRAEPQLFASLRLSW
ncbi:MAG: TonB-dependent receptor [Thauera sp.]|nr:TonB-dependent receptor [Thauera sp.]